MQLSQPQNLLSISTEAAAAAAAAGMHCTLYRPQLQPLTRALGAVDHQL